MKIIPVLKFAMGGGYLISVFSNSALINPPPPENLIPSECMDLDDKKYSNDNLPKYPSSGKVKSVYAIVPPKSRVKTNALEKGWYELVLVCA